MVVAVVDPLAVVVVSAVLLVVVLVVVSVVVEVCIPLSPLKSPCWRANYVVWDALTRFAILCLGRWCLC